MKRIEKTQCHLYIFISTFLSLGTLHQRGEKSAAKDNRKFNKIYIYVKIRSDGMIFFMIFFLGKVIAVVTKLYDNHFVVVVCDLCM